MLHKPAATLVSSEKKIRAVTLLRALAHGIMIVLCASNGQWLLACSSAQEEALILKIIQRSYIIYTYYYTTEY
jgi:hypothetical protein